MTIPPTKIGDIFLLFEAFPFEFDADLPLACGPCVYLDHTPHSILQNVKPSANADFVLPGYHLDAGTVNCCFRCPVSETRPLGIEPGNLFFMAITALRLNTPLSIHVAGQFEVGDPDSPMGKHSSLYYIRSTWSPNSRYNSNDILSADKIARRYIEILENKYKRLISAVVLYFQADFTNFFQPSYLSLFASLEALFVPQGNKAKTLARRVTSFLANIQFPFPVADWLEKEYTFHRGNLAHGIQDVMPWSTLSKEELEAFSRLHELTRLSILGFISLENDVLEKHSSKSGSRLQNELGKLSVGGTAFLQNQKPHCS